MDKKILISKHKNAYDSNPIDTPIIDFIKGIRDGEWQDDVLDTRIKLSKTEDKKEKNKIKAKNVLFRVSGSFSGQKDTDLRKHSGFIAIDIDNVDNPNKTKEVIKNDPYVYAAFLSISGKGLCLMFRIDGGRHLDAFNGLAEYLYGTYQLVADQSCKNVSRARYVSYDPHIIINEDAVLFKKYPPKPKKQKVNRIVYVESDLDRIITEIHNRGINLCEDYSDWISICYALVSQFGDTGTGRGYFHTLSSLSSKYNADDCDRQYKSCLKTLSDKKQKQSTISTIYHFAKMNGIETYSKQTRDIIRSAASQYKSGSDKNSIAKSLKKFNGIEESDSIPVIEQVISQGIEHQTENIIDDILSFLQPYELKKNLITRNVELNGKPIDDDDINTIFIDCKSVFDKATKDLVCSVMFSKKIPRYNPIKQFLSEHEHTEPNSTPNLDLLLDSINTDTPNYRTWITKWLVSMIGAANDQYSPLLLVLCGEVQGTGKTEFFRRLLPKQLRYLFGESKMDGGKDDEILMTKKWIIFDDEFGGKSKREEKRLKEITSKEFINVREPYGRVAVDLRRLSVFCGSSNDNQVLSDPTGNRRILPIHVLSIDHDKYNSSNKEMLFHEINCLYKSGYDWRVLKEDIEKLNESTGMFTLSTPEEELISSKIKPCENEHIGEWMSITQIIQYIISDTKYNNMSNTRIGMILTRVGYKKVRKKVNGIPTTLYLVEKITDFNKQGESDTPF